MLRRNGQPAKETKKFGKNPDVNLLFDDEKPKAKTRRTEKLRRVIDLSDAIRKQIVRIDDKKLTSGDRAQKILKKRAPKWTEKLNPTTMSYFVEVDTKTPSSAGTGISTGSKSENSRTLEDDAGSTLANSNNPEINNRIPDARIPDGSILKSASFENLRKKMSSHSRLEGSELHHLHEKAAERKFSKMSTGSNSKTMGQPGLHLRRQLSEIDLNLLDENERDQSMEPHLDISKDDKRTACLYPGWEVGQHCHSVAASVLNRGWPEPCISSSSSSDDLFESTKYSREIIEEKLRGLELEKKQEGERSKEVKEKKRKGKLKHKRGSKCNCKNKKHHSKCSHPVLPKANVSEESLHESEVSKTPSALMVSSKDNVNPSPSQLIQVPQDTKEKLGSTANLVDDQSDKSSSSEEILKRSCNRDTCPSLNKGLPEEIDDSESQRITSCETMKKPKDDEKLKSEVVKEPTPSSLRLKTGISDAGSSASTIRPEYCTQETCDFSKNQTQIRNAELHKQFEISKSEHSHKTTIKKEICSPKTCKMSGCRYKKLFSSKAKKSKARIKIGRLRRRIQLQRKHHNFICDCQNVYVDNQDSDSDDLWSDKELKRSRNRRYCLNLEHLKTRALRKCGGYMTEGHRCNCYTCYIKEKPWKDFLKKPNALLDVPYPLTTKALKLRAQNTNTLSKKLRNKYNWSEENLKNFCTRHEVCKKPNLRKSLLRENPFTWEWKWCQKDAVEKKVKKKEVPKEDNPGRFGYFVKIKEERLTRGEHFTNVQKIIEKAVFCKWNLDSAEMKLNHFLENMPKQQTCYFEGKTFDSDRRTCYNPKLIERLSDMTNFNEEPDRKIHEFSFPPKLLKYQEPQLVGDIGTDMPEIKPVLEVAKFPTLYRDLFKDQKRDLRKLVDAIFPPLQWTDKAGLWEMKVSIKPDNGDTNIALLKYLDFNETLCHAINKNFCAGRYRLYFELFAEMIRQEMIDYPERAFLLARIREEFLLTLLLYDGGLEMTLVGTTHLWKGIEEDTIDIMEKTVLEEEIEDLKLQIKGVTIATYDLEKRVEEQSQTRDYQFKDQEKLYKRTNHQLAAQFENITAGLLYDLD
ncbi:hypothetical protein GE061_011838 [Apolygus lucorum]|uniref:Uncharacterized protein n=1 Tax=Apolygus lucorum TaxID=248454 RepID=A0A8S9XYW7_APOLU|nr:hypothetical protein GE061_011838 [Apolygus lucorum]